MGGRQSTARRLRKGTAGKQQIAKTSRTGTIRQNLVATATARQRPR